ncbi:MAG: riboflavin synthase [Qipengyuania sp.]|nr:riboflavin synthase [Qipengyuania sp.]
MFTGIVTAIGTVVSVERRGDLHLRIACPWDPERIAIGASIACSGVCLTVVETGVHRQAQDARSQGWFAVDVSGETVGRTVHGLWDQGRRLNLEPALRLGDELGGHLVTGHVDAVGEVTSRSEDGGSSRLAIRAPAAIAPFIAAKGSIALDGVSLTVNTVSDEADGSAVFGLNIIPHTADVTTLGALAEGDAVNLEIDVLARYLQRMESLRR